jgi:hypothetical protein
LAPLLLEQEPLFLFEQVHLPVLVLLVLLVLHRLLILF